MTDISVTAANVRWVSGTGPRKVKAGAAITAGQAVYQDTADLEHKPADADTDAASELAGIAITDGQDGREMIIAPPGARINFGATLVAGTIYVVSTGAGGIAPEADLGSGDYVTIVAIGEGTAVATIIGAKGGAVHA